MDDLLIEIRDLLKTVLALLAIIILALGFIIGSVVASKAFPPDTINNHTIDSLNRACEQKLAEQKLNYEHIILGKEQECEAKVSRMLMQKCVEEEMPAGGGMKLEFGNLPQGLENGDYTIVVENNHPESAYIIPVIELPPEWGIGDVILDGKENK